MPKKTQKAIWARGESTDTRHGLWILCGLTLAVSWTLVGCGVAAVQGVNLRAFLREWMNYQGFFLIWLGAWLLLIIRSRAFVERVSRLTADGAIHRGVAENRLLRLIVVGGTTILGFCSLARMGFYGQGSVLIFMWFTCLCIVFTSGLVTLHSLEILAVMHNLKRQDIKVSRYAPARTTELKTVVTYFGTFTLLMTVGYGFALLGTITGHWTGAREYVDVIRLFWPVIYVPTCCVVLIYPHIVVHKLIQREKDRTLSSYQRDMDELLSKYGQDLKTEEIERTNTLAQLCDRIAATPNYVMDTGIAFRTVLPLLFNLITLVLKIPGLQK